MTVDIEDIMEQICDRCHWPYVCDEDELEERCEECPIEKEIQKLLRESAQ